MSRITGEHITQHESDSTEEIHFVKLAEGVRICGAVVEVDDEVSSRIETGTFFLDRAVMCRTDGSEERGSRYVIISESVPDFVRILRNLGADYREYAQYVWSMEIVGAIDFVTGPKRSKVLVHSVCSLNLVQ